VSSLTIEVDDPEDAYENLRAMLEAAPIEFSQITSVRLELEYESAADDAAPTAAGDASEPTEQPAAGFTDPTMIPSSEDDAPAPPIDDAETSEESTPETAVDGADEISFREPDDHGDDDQRSVFGDPDESDGTDSVFSTPDDAVSFGDPGSDTSQQSDPETTEDGRPLGSTVDRSTAGPGTVDSGNGNAATSASEGQQGTVNLSPQTYNKVVRLLQNRDFPIERGEIEDVAVGAYDIDVEECSAVIDTAIEKGLVAQDGSQLVDPTA